ncbi:glycoside hydrolase family 38 C-terminal domain-containing protein [Arachidicoccus sp.]|uniref:glycoside hydrolase family 38 N-terminal domain-containing protein n=1 Tax=Arachidicoccus sp. TaxID=1872624 RepID=UPI003D21743E
MKDFFLKISFLGCFIIAFFNFGNCQSHYFVDGYHGGIWGHYPYDYSRFIADELDKNPNWKLNLEVEPVTWDSIERIDPVGYNRLKKWIDDSSVNSRIEYINPDYGQSYLFNISGESIIRQFYYGMQKLREHFPAIKFTTYSSEEPCFTNALPQILKSYGFKYAVLKNPNTCWAGYVAPHSGEFVNWIGPDGSSIRTVPRYEDETFVKNSTWQTIAWNNDANYIKNAIASGIENPVGMCIQDAGWRNGPWLGNNSKVRYTTWRGYFAKVFDKRNIQNWKLPQEDIKVSLVWGSQLLQRVAKAVRETENKLIATETIASINKLYFNQKWPGQKLDVAWKDLLLAQHHDCWVVPNNRKYGKNWQQYVTSWTSEANSICDTILQQGYTQKPKNLSDKQNDYLRIYNTTGHARTEILAINLPKNLKDKTVKIVDEQNRPVPIQQNGAKVYFLSNVPAVGFTTYQIIENHENIRASNDKPLIALQKNGVYKIETDRYQILIDPMKGGCITSLIIKGKSDHDFVLPNKPGLLELRGFFYKQGVFRSSTENPASIKILENGGLYASLQVKGLIANNTFTQIITVTKNGRTIQDSLQISWLKNIGIGKYDETGIFKNENLNKAFYNNKYKLLTLFPVNISNGEIYKDAPFDILKSNLKNTFFDRWDSIKNVVLLHWVDLGQKDKKFGFALFSDETTSYAHGQNLPLGLVTQYSGKGLFGADYNIDSSTSMNFSLLPHYGDWAQGKVNDVSQRYNKPLIIKLFKSAPLHVASLKKSCLKMGNNGWIISSLRIDGKDVLLRLFNASGNGLQHRLYLNGSASSVESIRLDGKVEYNIPLKNGNIFELSIPRFGFKTIRIHGLINNRD